MSIMNASPSSPPPAAELAKLLREGKRFAALLKEGVPAEHLIEYLATMDQIQMVAAAEVDAGKAWLRERAQEVFAKTKTSPVLFASSLGPVMVSNLGRQTFAPLKTFLTEGKAHIPPATYALLFEERVRTEVIIKDGYADAIKTLPHAQQVALSGWIQERPATPAVKFPSVPTII